MELTKNKHIGERDKRGTITRRPTHFITGILWNQRGNGVPTFKYFGPDNRYFCVLPIGVVNIDQETLDELLALVAPPVPITPVAPITPVTPVAPTVVAVEPVVTVEPVVAPIKSAAKRAPKPQTEE